MFPFGLQGLGTKPSLVCVVFSPQQKATTQWNLNVCFPHVYTYNLSFHHLIVQKYLVSTYHFIILLFRNIWLLFTNLASYHLNYNISYIYIIMFMLYQFLDSMRFLFFCSTWIKIIQHIAAAQQSKRPQLTPIKMNQRTFHAFSIQKHHARFDIIFYRVATKQSADQE